MKHILVGFDSAWSATNEGAIAAVSVVGDQTPELVLPPTTACFSEARGQIDRLYPNANRLVVFLDQPHIVPNKSGSRPVEKIVSSLVGRRYGGMQSSAAEQPTVRLPMFGVNAPIWDFLRWYGGPADPFHALDSTPLVFETYPVLYIIANNWLLSDRRECGRLPKYNPSRPATFNLNDWRFLCKALSRKADELGLRDLTKWIEQAGQAERPNKILQDKLDAAICLVQAVDWHYSDTYLVIGDTETGYIITKSCAELELELMNRCKVLQRKNQEMDWNPSYWIKQVKRASDGTTSKI